MIRIGLIGLMALLLHGQAGFNNSSADADNTQAVPTDSAGVTLDPNECLDCHDDETLTMERDGEEILLDVDPDEYFASQHSGLDCLECHVGFDPYEEPHKEVIEPVDCSSCHGGSSRAHARGAHAAELSCASCHSNVHTASGTRSGQRGCRNCHEDAVAEVAISAHAANGAGPTCLDCHSPHRFATAESATCLSCHGEREFVHEHVTHEDLEVVLAYQQSIHADVIECADCHEGHLVYSTDDERSAVSRSNMASTCAGCHEAESEHYASSEHGKALAAGFEYAPSCTDCHGEHDIHQISDAESSMSRSHEVEVCLSCHLDSPDVQQRMTHTSAFVAAYEWSVHGQAALGGDEEAAICSDCHGAHDEMKATNPNALINKFNLSSTCGRCHEDVRDAFVESTHGDALVRGVGDAPTCTTCHSEHAILRHGDSNSPVAVVNVSEQVCAPCHESFKLSEKYGFPSDRTASFSDSYHGLAGRFGSAESANCASCHGVHDIWPSIDPRSSVHPDNLPTTCGECHPGATAQFASGSVHVIRSPQGDQLLYWIGAIYLMVIVATIGTMSVHNVLDWVRKTSIRYARRLEPQATAIRTGSATLYVRMTRNERVQHILLASSFSLLVITGFMLKFPDAWGVVGLRDLLGVRLFDLRGLIHRIAAVIMVGDSVYHLYYVVFTKRGRTFINDIKFNRRDLPDLWQMFRFNIGKAPRRPLFDRFNYIEKAEYWAVIWGTVVMTVTGIVLWFENPFMSRFSKLFIDVNETIHYYEAWLAFLAIVVWHFYYVIFNPDVYPMNFSWLTGKLTEEEMEHEHPLELDRLRQEGGEPPEAPTV